MVGEVCEREVSKYTDDSTGNSSNSSVVDAEDIKLQVAVSLTFLVGVIQVCRYLCMSWSVLDIGGGGGGNDKGTVAKQYYVSLTSLKRD